MIKINVPIELDPKEYGLFNQKGVEESFKALNDLYREIWCEAFFDPTNEDWKAFAQKLLPLIQKANEGLGFKK